jgi:hypothetical protein
LWFAAVALMNGRRKLNPDSFQPEKEQSLPGKGRSGSPRFGRCQQSTKVPQKIKTQRQDAVYFLTFAPLPFDSY